MFAVQHLRFVSYLFYSRSFVHYDYENWTVMNFVETVNEEVVGYKKLRIGSKKLWSSHRFIISWEYFLVMTVLRYYIEYAEFQSNWTENSRGNTEHLGYFRNITNTHRKLQFNGSRLFLFHLGI